MKPIRCTPVAIAITLALSPVVVQAEGGFYGSIRLGFQYRDAGGDTDADLDFTNWASRLGYAANTDLENGWNAFGKLEFGADARSASNVNGALSTRQAYVGLGGNFGSILLGQTYHTWYNTVIAPVDQPWWGSCNGCLAYSGRTSDGVSYKGASGKFSFGVTAYLIPTNGTENADELDGFEIGVSYDAGIANIGVGIQDLEGEEATIGAVVSGTQGAVGYAANITKQDAPDVGGEDATGIDVFLSYGKYYLDVGTIDAGDKSTGFTLGYTHRIGQATTSWFEISSFDAGIEGVDTTTTARAALKFDWK